MSSLRKGVKNTSKSKWKHNFSPEKLQFKIELKRVMKSKFVNTVIYYAFMKALVSLLCSSVKNKLNDLMNMFIWDQELSQKRCRSSGVIAAVDSFTIRDKCIKRENCTIHKVMWGMCFVIMHFLSDQQSRVNTHSTCYTASPSLSTFHTPNGLYQTAHKWMHCLATVITLLDH